ncbi:MAG TPA: SGNH/GDSL hydrolase family protein [Bryobacteraceae bacterium]|nr:SGNH/GDSL hydrolase family protein [Bryobacteraceae bacterium]
MRKIALLAALLLAIGVEGATLKKHTRKKHPASRTTASAGTITPPKRRSVIRRAVAHIVPVSAAVRARAVEKASNQVQPLADAFDNPAALVPFFERLYRLEHGGDSVHVLHFGDSHTASDDLPAALRAEFQSRFGNGGPGFAFAGHPFKGYRRFDVSGSNSNDWYTEGIVTRPDDGKEGLGGISLQTTAPGQTISFTAEADQLELYCLRQPDGGGMQFYVDGSPVETIDTSGQFGSDFFSYVPAAGVHQYELVTATSAPVRVFGWVAQNHQGITWETLGINGASADILLNWDENLFDSQIARRDPALVVLAYGTNEAVRPRFDAMAYRESFRQVLQRIRHASPATSILVVGPPDCMRNARGQLATFGHLDEIIDIQRAVAREEGCAFWDWRRRMGGPGSKRTWVQAGFAQSDYVHFTSSGYQLIGKGLSSDLLLQYSSFLNVRSEIANEQQARKDQ